ncbi:MAG: class I SAM-dependent methyltransferase [Phycisphaerales bacterium]
MGSALRTFADVGNPDSFSNRMRNRRFQIFAGLLEPLPKPVRILDVGGTNLFWRQRGWADENQDVRVTVVNLEAEAQEHENIETASGDATSMPQFEDKSFDVVFSNSVIEHLFTWENQQKMAAEVRRIGKAYWVQTPNFWFPMEPHFHVPGWHWMPKSMRVALLRRRQCGWRGPVKDKADARRYVDEVRLMSKREMRKCFPEATIWGEKFYGLTKSWVARHGFDKS